MTDLTPRIRSEGEPGGFELLVQLERAGALTEVSLTLSDPNLPYETYEALAEMLGRVKRTCSWLIGDLANHGEALYGNKYEQAIERTGLAVETLMNYASVCRRVPRSRRRAGLSFGHHQTVAALDPAGQSRWLEEAERREWSRTELRRALDEAAESPPRPEQPQWTITRNGEEGVIVAVSRTATGDAYGPLTPPEPVGRVLPRPTATGLAEAVRRLLAAAARNGDGTAVVPLDLLDELAALIAAE